MPGFHRQRHHFGHRGGPLKGAVWMIGIGFLMLTGDWWPGILVLIGISMVIGAFVRETPKPFLDERDETDAPPFSSPLSPTPVQPVRPSPVETNYRSDLLPSNCSQCGGPIRSTEVRWLGSRSASCPYCGSTLTLKKS